jgi:hypothetical protein
MSGPTGTTAVLDGDGLEAIAVGRAVERMPRHLRRIGVEPQDLGWGAGLREPVERSIEGAAGMILDYLRTHPGD